MSEQMPIYQSEDGETQIDVRFDYDTIWLSQIQNRDLVVKESLITADDGKRYKTRLYNLDVVINEYACSRARSQ